MLGWYILRLWVLVLLEVSIYTGTAGALLLGARTYQEHRALQSGAYASLDDLAAGALSPREISTAETPRGTFMGMNEELLLQRMQEGQVKSLKFNRGGSSVSFRLEFADGSRVAFKPTQINPQSVPRKEVAAYRLNRLLGLNYIAPATLRTLSREDVLGKLAGDSAAMRPRVEAETIFENGGTLGVLSYWIPTIMNMGLDSSEGVNRWTEWLTIGDPVPRDKAQVLAQLSTLLVFDLLQNNSDRWSGGNLMGSPDGKMLYFMDNAFGFQVDREGHQRCRSYLYRAQKFSRRFVLALRQLDKESLQKTMNEPPGPVLNEAEIDAVLGRRNVALRYINDLIQQHGEDRVLVFP